MSQLADRRIQRNMAYFFIGLVMVLVALSVRIAWVQFVDGKRLTQKAKVQLYDNKALQSPRGTIYDRNGRELAISTLTKSLYANPTEVNVDKDMLASWLAPILDMPLSEVKKCLVIDRQFIWIKRMLEPTVSQQIDTLIKEKGINGLAFLEESKRYYPNDSLAAQVMGFVGTDDIGLDGLEMTLDKVIKGQLSEERIDTDNRGLPIFKSIFTYSPNKQGRDVYLTLDSAIQFIVEQGLDGAMTRTRSVGATVIVMNPRNGEILAMASRPTYNPNEFFRYGANEWKNRAVSNIYEPGSTFKSVVAAAALQEGLVSPDERFYDKGFVQIADRRIKNWSDESYGNVSFTDIIKNSINTGFVEVGMRLGANRLNHYTQAFGFGQATGVELPGEEEGLLFATENMRNADLATMSIGQSIAVTPLQLLTAVSAIANDGVLLKPHIIKEIHNADGSIFSATATTSVRQVITPDTARKLTVLLEKVVSEGGGKRASVPGYRLAGKTGTAEKLRESGSGYYSGRYIASFVGFGPVEDPQVAILVVLDDPQGVYYGGEIAAPVAGEILGKILRYLNIYPQSLSGVVPPKQTGSATKQPERQPALPPPIGPIPAGKVVMPDVRGKSIREASALLNKLGLAMTPNGSGVASKQSIPANSIVDVGSEITVQFEGL